MKREFLMLAQKYTNQDVRGWMMSEKLDGQRAFWDGGVTRGMLKAVVPWANTDKDERYIGTQYATGLWSRLGNVIHAPDWFLDQLPAFPLDGELYVRYDRQRLRTIISRLTPGPEWKGVEYYVFDSPPLPESGTLWGKGISVTGFPVFSKRCFIDTLRFLEGQQLGVARLLHQEKVDDKDHLLYILDAVTTIGGEGMMLRSPYSYWAPERSKNLLKVKKLDDMEGTVIGYTAGRRTDKGSKLLGLMGALVLRLPSGVRLELSGFTEEERQLNDSTYALDHPGEELPSDVYAVAFPRGMKVTFRYRGLTNDGVPNEARFWRGYNE